MMKVYKLENSVKDLLLSETSASFYSKASLTEDKTDLLIKNLNKIKKDGCAKELSEALAAISEDQHPDLMYGSAILVSTVINGNDDVFLSEYTWAAKGTEINMPYNNFHQKKMIIGHIIDSKVINASAELTNDIPDYFDIEVDFVMYKSIHPDIAREIFTKASKNEAFVSMECKFDDFGYALIDNDGNATLVDRNESTAFLTKYLRMYGGSGMYKDQRIGRVLKDFRFVGMGNVDEPANSKSEYTKLSNYKNLTAEYNTQSDLIFYLEKDKKMKKIETLEQAQAVIDDLNKELDSLKAKEAQSTSELSTKLASAEAEKSTITQQLTESNTKLSVAEQKLTEVQNELTKLNEQVKTVTAELDTKKAELQKIADDAKTAVRIAKAKELGIDIDDAKIEKIKALTDDAFASLVEFTEAINKKNQTSQESQASVEPNITVEPETDKGIENTQGNTETAEAALQRVAEKLVQAVKVQKGKRNSAK